MPFLHLLLVDFQTRQIWDKIGGVKTLIYGYCRISTDKQNIERQIRNILKAYPKAEIWQEAFTGTKTEGRKKFEQLMKIIKSGDILVFDSVSRMSRNAEIGFQIYQELYDKGVELVFLKEPHINTTTYKKAMSNNIRMTGTKTDIILKAINLQRNKSSLLLSNPKKKYPISIREREKGWKLQDSRASRSDAKEEQLLSPKKELPSKKESKNTPRILTAHCQILIALHYFV